MLSIETASGVLQRAAQVTAGAIEPFTRRAAIRLGGAPDIELGARRRAVAAVEVEQRVRCVVCELCQTTTQQRAPGRLVAYPRALQVQEAQLLGAIEHPEIAIELQAVDDGRRIVEIDVLRPQVAVRLHDAAAVGALCEH